MLLEDKVVIVSGIGPGLGVNIALQAALQGARLVLAARTAEKLDKAEEAIVRLKPDTRVLKIPTDISEREQCKRLTEAALSEFGRIDVLINNAYEPGCFDSIDSANLESWRTALSVNLFGTMNLTLETIPQMKRQGGGAIVMVNTMVVRKPMAKQGGYGASKAALTSATAHLALELGKYNIRVNSTYMGWMWGPAVEGYLQSVSQQCGRTVDELREEVEKKIPLGKIPDSADCAKAVIFLASDLACAITGAQLDVNGGEYIPH